MKRHVRSKKRRIFRKLTGPVEGTASSEAEAEIGSRVFSLPTLPAASMPTVARRSSTRVFVPKVNAVKQHGSLNSSIRVLRSGKLVDLSGAVEKTEENIPWLERDGEKGSGLSQGAVHESDANEMADPRVKGIRKMFENVYTRKRRRIMSLGLDSPSSKVGEESKDSRFGIVFSRKHRKKKPKAMNDVGNARDNELGGSESFSFKGAGASNDLLQIRESNRNFLEIIDISEDDLWSSFDDPLVLVVLLESSFDDNLLRLRRFLISVISWMSKGRMSLHYFNAFLLSEPMSNTLSRHGIHFLPLAHRNGKFLIGSSFSNFPACKIYSTMESLPLIFLNFRALPSFFESLQLAILLGFQYLPSALSTYLLGLDEKLCPGFQCEYCDSHVPMATNFSGTVHSFFSAAVNRNGLLRVVETSAVGARSAGILCDSKPRKLQRKRSSWRQSRPRSFSSVDSHSTLWSSDNGAIFSSADPLHTKVLETFICNPFSFYIDKDISTLPGSHLRFVKVSKKGHGEQMKEIKATLSEIKQNIDSVRCKANVLVTAGDKCWREEGAEVLLELSCSREWCLVVKIGGSLRFYHKPQDMKYTLNRFTHSHMWIVEDGWSLEFTRKWDWLTFKELHAECCQRNNPPKQDASEKVIPVPVFQDVPASEDDNVSGFGRPEQYIRMTHDDEISRALLSEVPYYDMDSEDEEWLKKHKSRCSTENGISSSVSDDTFERMIFTFEKDAYCSPSNVPFLESKPNNHEDLRRRGMVADAYDYWLKRRKQRHAPLVRVFQSLSLRKPQLMQRQVLRKRRSLKRQRSQVGRGKPACGFDSKAKEDAKAEAVLQVQEAQNAWRRSIEAAVPLRHRAQLLMEYADLAAYKSATALRIAEAIESKLAVVSSIFDSLALVEIK